MLPSKRLTFFAFYGFVFCLLVFGSFSCGNRSTSETITLDKATYNSYFHNHYPDGLSLTEHETLIYDNGMQKVSTIAADIDLEHCRFRLSIIDGDMDGNYTSPEADKVVLSPFGQDTIAIDFDRPSVGPMNERMFIQVDREWFLLSDIDSLSGQMTITRWPNCPKAQRAAVFNTHWKPLEVRNEVGELTYLDNNKDRAKKQMILVLRRPPVDHQMLVNINDSKAKWEEDFEMTIIYLSGYEANEWSKYIETIDFKFPSYFTTTNSCKVINCHANPPYAFVLNKSGMILKEGIKENEIYRLLGLSYLIPS